MNKIRTYNDPLSPDFQPRVSNGWISDEAYREMVQKMPITCTDVVFIVKNDKAIYVGKRIALPMSGIWIFGGRMNFNDNSFEESLSRIMEIEVSHAIDPKRFNYLCTNLYSWVVVAQGNFPGKNVGITYSCEVTKEELEKMSKGLNPKEYDLEFGIQRFDRDRLINGRIHPALVDIYRDLF